DPALERDAPLPSAFVRHRSGIGHWRADRLCLYRQGSVGGQPLIPRLEPGFERLLDQQAAKPRAVDEQISFHRLPGFKLERADEAGIGVLPDMRDLAFDPLRSRLLGQLAKKPRIE